MSRAIDTSKIKHWVIIVGGGYGAFLLDGSEQEAEEIRVHKANLEQAVARKRPATDIEIESGEASECWNHKNFNNRFNYSCGCQECSKGTTP